MKIVYDNIIFSLQKIGGISVYWYELIKRLEKSKNNIIFFDNINNNIVRKQLNIKYSKESSFPVTILRYLPFRKRIPGNSIFHSSYYRVSLQKSVINVVTVHDFTYEYFRKGLPKLIHVWQKYFAIKRADAIICVSENTKKDLLEFYPKIDKHKIKVIYNGVSNDFFKLEYSKQFLNKKFHKLKGKKYLLFVGSRVSYKNFDVVISIIKLLTGYSLVVVGQDFNEKEKSKLESIMDKVFLYKNLSNEDLNIIYNNAFALLYPSSYEGFGIPILEAMKAGCPVISAKFSSIPEVGGDTALLVKEINVDSFIKLVKKLENDNYRKNLINKGFKQSKKFSWDKCYEETFNFYSEIYNKKFSK